MPALEDSRQEQVDAIGDLDVVAGEDYAAGMTPTTQSSSSTTAGALSATIPAVAGQYSYLTAFEITGAGATAASVILITVTGLAGGTSVYFIAVPAGAAVGITPLTVDFPKPLRSSAVNTAINISVPTFGAGNVAAALAIHGYNAA